MKLKTTFEGGPSYISFKSIDTGALNMGYHRFNLDGPTMWPQWRLTTWGSYASRPPPRGDPMSRGLHSSTVQLNLSASYGIGGARRGCVARAKWELGAVEGV